MADSVFEGFPREILDALPLSCICWDESLYPVFCNTNAVRMFNAGSKEELLKYLYRSLTEGRFKPGAEKKLSYFNLQKALDRGRLWLDLDIQTVSGESVPADTNIKRIMYDGENYLMAAIRDAGGRLAAWARTKESEERLQILFDTTPMCIRYWEMTEFNGDGSVKSAKVVDCNQEAVRMFGLESKDEFINRFFDLSPEFQPDGGRSYDKTLKYLSECPAEGYSRFEWMHRKPDGEEIPCEITLARVKQQNKIMIAGYTQDLRAIKASMAKLREADELTKLLMDATPLCVNLWDKSFRNVECNEEAIRMFNTNDKQTYLDRFFELSPTRQPDGRLSTYKCVEMVVKAFKEGYCRFNWEHQTLDGERMPTEITLARVKYKDEYMVAGYTRDLREHEAILSEMRRVEIAEESNKLKNKFLATISHEIRTPMNSIMGITEIQLLNEKLPDETREALSRIYSSSNLLLHIVNDILDMSKIEAGKLELMINPYQTASLINDSVQMNILQYESKPIEFKLKVSENIPVILKGDELRIKQIVNNLLSNAFKYTDKGFITLTVDTERDDERDDGVHLIFEIRDTGQGMTEAQVRHLFDEYSRFNMEANRMTVGTGLGMSITNSLVQMMNGKIDIESEPGKGTVFTVRLPQHSADTNVIGRDMAENLERFRFNNPAAQAKTAQIVREPMPYGRVLLVDDMETNLYVGKGLLTPYEIQVETAISGIEAVSRVESGQVFDIIFMDHMMPKMDGLEATKIIRGMGYKKPIVALTANAVVGQAEIFLQNGIDDFIPKPIDTRRLNQILNKMVRDVQPPEVVASTRNRKRDIASQNAEAAMNVTSSPLAQSFMHDAEKTIGALEEVYANRDNFTDADMQNHIIHSHAIKSALANMGESALSKRAETLEEWGRLGNTGGIFAEIPMFLMDLKTYAAKVAPRKNEEDSPVDAGPAPLTPEARKMWEELRDACNNYNKKAAKKIAADLAEITRDKKYSEALESVSRHLLHSSFEEAGEAASSALSD